MGPCYPRLQTSPGAGRPQLGTPGSILPGQEGSGARLVALGRPGPASSLPTQTPLASAGSGPWNGETWLVICWRVALTVFPRYSALGRALCPSAGHIFRSLPFPPPLQSSQNQAGGTWGWSWGGPGEEGGSAHQSALPSTPRSSRSLAPSSQAQSSFPFNIRDAVCLARGFTWSLICTTLCNTCTNIHTHSLFHISGVQGHLLIPCLWQSRPPGPEERGALGRWGRSRQSLYRCWAHFSGEVVNPSWAESLGSRHFLQRSVGSAFLLYESLVSSPHLPRSSF